MDILAIVERLGETPTATLFGLITGIIFGVAAERSNFCLRAATVDFARGHLGPRLAVWLLCFSTALVWVQGAHILGLMRAQEARMMAVPGSWSGAIIGGLMFGIGMILARGCPGRLLVLAATGNLRSVVSGLIFAVAGQMSLHGWLSPLRDRLAALWITSGGHNRDLLQTAGLTNVGGLMVGLGFAMLALWLARRNRISFRKLFFGAGVGFAVAMGWVLTFSVAQVSFDPMQVESLTFTGPSANTLMFFLERPAIWQFDIGLVPGVFVGAFFAAWVGGDLRMQGFENEVNMRKAMIGAALMGFGGMLAGGCSIGAGVSGTSIFVGTAWVALISMWIGGVLTDTLIDQPRRTARAV